MKNIFLILLLCCFSLLHGQNRIIGGEYWFDSHSDGRAALSFSPGSSLKYAGELDVSGLFDGLHTVHIRFMDDSSRWSSPVSAFFMKSSKEGESDVNTINTYEYWFDDGYLENVQTEMASGSSLLLTKDIDVSSLSDGLHTLNLRFKDARNIWSSAFSAFFLKSTREGEAVINTISSYEYWFDNSYNEVVKEEVSGEVSMILARDINVTGLQNGLHTLSIRFKDARNVWSSAVSRFFMKFPESTISGDNAITHLEYWFDSSVDAKNEQPITEAGSVKFIGTADVSSLAEGLHTISYRFKDSRGLYSSAVSRFFMVQHLLPEGREVKITGYRYWLDGEDIYYGTLQDSLKEIVFLDSLDLREYPKGEYFLNFQFMDNLGRWSSAISDTIQKISFPFAVLTADRYMVCVGDSFTFSARVVDADSLVWMADGLQAGGKDTIDWAFTSEGMKRVSVMAIDTVLDISNSYDMEQEIMVYALPVIELGENFDLCVGESAEIQGPVGLTSYSWSTGSSESAIVVNEGGRYYLVVQDVNGCMNNDSIDMTLRALPVVDLGDSLEILNTENRLIDAGAGMVSYLWNGAAGSNQYMVSGPDLGIGEHMLELNVENEYGCTNSDTLYISVSFPIGVEGNAFTDFRIYPNPMTDFVKVDWNATSVNEVKITLVDLAGRVHLVQPLQGPGQEVNVSRLQAGKYIMIIEAGGERRSVAVVKGNR